MWRYMNLRITGTAKTDYFIIMQVQSPAYQLSEMYLKSEIR